MYKILLIALSFNSFLSADMFQPSHHCSKPNKPYKFTSQWEVDNFKTDVGRYKDCISRFVSEQSEAIEKHRSASNKAVEEWNSYARSELN